MQRLPLNVSGRILFGPFPSDQTLMQLRQQGVKVIWNLMAELPELFRIEKQLFPQALNTPIDDYDIPSDASSFLGDLDKVVEYLQTGQDVYIHCLGGHGRTGMALSALTVRLAKVSPEAALQFSLRHCQGPEREHQKQFIRETL